MVNPLHHIGHTVHIKKVSKKSVSQWVCHISIQDTFSRFEDIKLIRINWPRKKELGCLEMPSAIYAYYLVMICSFGKCIDPCCSYDAFEQYIEV